MNSKLIVRKGVKLDLPFVFALINELAKFERAPHEVTNSVRQMEKDGFGDNPIFYFLVAEKSGKIVGASIYYWRYSTWKGKRLFLEDLIVTENERGAGVGKLLFEATINEAIINDCNGMSWQVLDWNEPAILFYKKYDSKFDLEWINCSLDQEQLRAYVINK